MKINRLYIRVFVSFMLLLIVAWILIILLFRASVIHRSFHEMMQMMQRANSFVAEELVNTRVRGTSRDELLGNSELRELIRTAGGLYKARVWLEVPGESLVIKSFEGDVPVLGRVAGFPPEKGMPFKKFHDRPPHHLRMPIRLKGGKEAVIFAVVDQPPRMINETVFIIGLFCIGIVFALLMIPLARHISIPLKEMSGAALKIADGKLKERVSTARKDEIGDLGRAFNLMADRLEEMILGTKELAANISHELRSPLARVAVALELLQGRITGGRDAGDLIQSIQNEVGEMDRIIGRILLLSRLDWKEQAEKREPVDVLALVSSAIERFDDAVKAKSLSLDFHAQPECLFLECNREEMGTAVMNVIDNAVKFTPDQGSVRVSVEESRGWIKITVRNSCGRPDPDDLEKIFIPFYRVTGTEKKGSGLGLAITRKIVEKMGGSIGASIWENGLEILISLPGRD